MTSAGHKRSRQSPDLYPLLSASGGSSSVTSAPYAGSASVNGNLSSSASSFRNVSACNRCRVRKNRCDQNLPACAACEKANVKCVGFDPITKREIPRTYVYYLESRVSYLEALLESNGVDYEPCTEFVLGSKPANEDASVTTGANPQQEREQTTRRDRSHTNAGSESTNGWEAKHDENEKINTLVSNIGMVSVQGASDPRFLGSTSGISFARVVAAAIKSSVPEGRKSKSHSLSAAAAATSGTSFRDSFFGLQSKPSINPAPFPDKDLGLKLVDLYFEHANPQIPTLHKGEFMTMFARAYQAKDKQRSSRELYLLNIVFAIGAGTILDDCSDAKESPDRTKSPPVKREPASPSLKRQKTSNIQIQPEEYHAAAMVHLETFLGSMPAIDRPEGFGGGLEQLQAVLLLASFALLRPVAPGLWYITGVAVRLGIDLGLHYEDGTVIDDPSGEAQMSVANNTDPNARGIDAKKRGRREWVRDLRRRLWWCVYSFDRLVSTCVGRPFGITDQVITTDWPSVLDDKDITTEGFLVPSHNFSGPSYKRVSHHYFRLRLLQSEILQVLQYRQAKRVHKKGRERSNQYMHTKLSSSFLQPFEDNFYAWRKDIDRRLWEWKESAPRQQDTTVKFSIRFLELNYWQAVIMLYRQSLSIPETFAGERGPHNEVESPLTPSSEDHEEGDEIFLKVAEAGQRVLKLYHQLHKAHVVNYTYLATVHLFMAGISFLYSVWHSHVVRGRLTIHDVNYTVLAGTSVLTDLMDKCPPAKACRDAFDRMSKATITMYQTTTGFGSQVTYSRDIQDSPIVPDRGQFPTQPTHSGSRPPPVFDYNLKDLFADYNPPSGPIFQSGQGWQFPAAKQQPPAFPYPSPLSTSGSMTSQPTTAQLAHQYDPRLFPPVAAAAWNPPNSIPMPSTTSATSSRAGADFSWTSNIDLQNADFDFLMQSDQDLGTNIAPYANLGFEDGQHDFDDGSAGMPDLFGGFFFGGPQEDAEMEFAPQRMEGLQFPGGEGEREEWRG